MGYLTRVTIFDTKKIKLRPKTIDFVFIEYIYIYSAYQFLIHKSSIEDNHPNTIIE